MEGQRITEDGNRRISQGNLIRITEDFIRVWELTPNSVSLSVATLNPTVDFDIAVISATANLITNNTNTAVVVDLDVEILSATVALSTTSANTATVVEIDVEVTSIPSELILASADSSVVVEIDVEILSTSGTLEIIPTVTELRFGPIKVTEGYILTIPVLNRAISLNKTDRVVTINKTSRTMEYYTNRVVTINETNRSIEYYTKRKSL